MVSQTQWQPNLSGHSGTHSETPSRREQSPPASDAKGGEQAHNEPSTDGVSLNRQRSGVLTSDRENPMSEFDAQSITARLKAETRIRRKPRTYAQRRSLLDNYKYELLQLDSAGCNGSELQRWIAEKGIKIQRSTVHRWLHRNRQNG